jgi:hypothetical protein
VAHCSIYGPDRRVTQTVGVGERGNNTGGVKILFLDKDEKESSAWHFAAYMGHIEVLHKLWEWAKIH